MSLTEQSSAILESRKNLSVCVLDGDASQVVRTLELLERAGFPSTGSARFDEAATKARLGLCRVILADCSLFGMDSPSFLERIRRQNPETHVIVMSLVHSVDSAIESIKHGAYDYLCKPLDPNRLAKTLDELIEHTRHSQRQETAPGQDWRPLPLSEMRRIHIQRVLETCNGNRVRAARMLGIGRTSLYRFLKSADRQTTTGVHA